MPPPTAQAALTRPLRRSADDRIVLGTCAGIATTLGVPTIVVRVAVILLGLLATQLMLIAYAAASVVIPRSDGRMTLSGQPVDHRESTLGWGLTALAALLVLAGNPLVYGISGIPRELIVVGTIAALVLALRDRTAPQPQPPAAAETGAECDPTVVDRPEPAAPTATLILPPHIRPDDPTLVTPAHVEPPTVAMTPDALEPPTAGTGPSLLAIGVAVLGLTAVLGTAWIALVGASVSPRDLLYRVATVGGLLALAGATVAITQWRQRHASGLLVLALLTGAAALALFAVAESGYLSDSNSAARALYDWLNALVRLD